MKQRTLSFGLIAIVLLGCTHAPAPAAAPVAPAQAPPPVSAESKPDRVEPPTAGVSPSAPFPAILHRELGNGLQLRVVERHTHPIIELRLVIRSGTADDGEKPGLSIVAGELLKAGGAGPWNPEQLVQRAESLGADLSVTTDRDSTRISLAVTSGDLDAALEVLAAVALRPAFAPIEFQKLRSREIERVRSAARGSAAWAASMVLYREIYDLPTGIHPYSRYDAMPEELQKLTLADCRAWHKARVTPDNASLIIAGDVSADQVEAAAKKWLGTWKGEAATAATFSKPFPHKEQEVFLVDRPGSAQSQVYVGMLGTRRAEPEWAALSLANQILGGGVSSRLFLDVRENRSLAYNTGSWLTDAAHAEGSVVLSAGTQTPKTADAVAALLENLQKIAVHEPLAAELDSAVRFLADGFVFKFETVGSVAELTSHLYVMGLPDDYFDEYRRDLRALSLPAVTAAAGRYYRQTPVIVVAGDAATLGPPLAKFGPVAVLDPEHGFTLKKSYPKRP